MAGEEYAMKWLTDRGYSPVQAAAVVGNGIQESGLQPSGVAGDNGTAQGAFQWRGPRLQALQQFATGTGQDWRTMDAQLGFLDNEMRGSEKGAGDQLFAATDVPGATRAMMAYERPQGYTAANPEAGNGYANRLSNAFRLAGVTQPSAPVGDVIAKTAGAAPAMAPAGTPGVSIGSLASQFMQQFASSATNDKAKADVDQARRRALFAAPAAMGTPAVQPGGVSKMFA